MKVLVIEMQRSVEHPTGNGPRLLQQGVRYTMDAKTAEPLLKPTRETVQNEETGAYEVVDVEPAAKVIRENDVPEGASQSEAAAPIATAADGDEDEEETDRDEG